MTSYDIVLFSLILAWVVVKIRTGKRLNQPVGIVIYMFVLVCQRIALSIFRLSNKSARRTKRAITEALPSPQTHPYEVSLGVLAAGRDFVVNIMKGHTLIGATSGGGKTYMLHNILKQLFDKGSMFFDNTDVYVVDLKGHPDDMIDLWRPLLAGYSTRIGMDMDDALAMLRNIEARLGQPQDKKILLIIDEVHILTNHKEGDVLLQNIASQLRLNGALMLLVQHSQYAIVKTFIRYNIERRICGLVMSRDQARVILDIRPREDELPDRVGEYLIREPGKNKLLRVVTPLLELPAAINETVSNVLAIKAEDIPEMKLLIDVIGVKKMGDSIAGVKTLASSLDVPNSQNYVMVAYRNFTNAGIFDPPRFRGGRYKMAVADVKEAINKLQEYLPNWQSAPESMIEESTELS